MGVFNGGELLRSFMPDKYERRYNSDTLQGEIDKTTKGMDAYRTGQAKTLDDYTAASARGVAWREKYAPANEAELNTMLAAEKNYDFLGDRERARSGDIAALEGVLGRLGGGMSKADKIGAARLGYAGRPSSGYLDRARNSYLGAFAQQPLNTILAGSTNAAQQAGNARRANVAQRLGLIDKRASLMDDIADQVLNPARARTAMLNDEIGALSGLGGVYKQNLAGWEKKVNPWVGAASAIDESLNSALDIVMEYYGGGMGGMGGGMGGMGGGMGGGGGMSGIMSGMSKGGGTVDGNKFKQYAMYQTADGSPWAAQYNPGAYFRYAQDRQQWDPTWNPKNYE